jgi:hypothetical protein
VDAIMTDDVAVLRQVVDSRDWRRSATPVTEDLRLDADLLTGSPR